LQQASGPHEFDSEYSVDTSGVITSEFTSWRMIMFSSKSMRALIDELYGRFSSGADVILYNMGFSYGADLVSSMRARAEKKRAETLQITSEPTPGVFKDIAQRSGWGNINLGGDLDHGSHISIIVANCAFCGEDDFQHRCPFLRGVTMGIASSRYKREYSNSAVCVRNKQGVHVCKFELNGK
jgi:hypothetical protein